MASLQQEPTGSFHIVIFHDGKRFKRSLKTKKESVALTRKEQIEETLDLVKRGRLSVPPITNLIDFVLAGGKPETIVKAPSVKPTLPQAVSQRESSEGSEHNEDEPPNNIPALLEQFLGAIPDGSLEDNTLSQMGTHKRHLSRLLGNELPLVALSAKHLQGYINTRAMERTHKIRDKSVPKKKQERLLVSAATIRKELVTLGSAWRWARAMGFLTQSLPKRGLRWPKTEEKPPFQTWEEIERQIFQDKLCGSEADLLWDCLYLRSHEMEELLKHVEASSRYPYVYPFFAMAAYTGARRSELIRSRKSDFDFDSRTVTIHELKRLKGKRSTRRVPICDRLNRIMQLWFSCHPGSTWTFASNDRLGSAKQVTKNQVQNQFNQTLKDSRWEPVKGWHCLRHSFISNLASAGVDQRIIDDFVGHTTEEMRQRYRHLLPDVKQAALNSVFGDANASKHSGH